MGFKDSKTAAECCILLALLIIPYTEAQNNWPSDVQQPENPTIVVEGVNSSKVNLVWGSPAKGGDIVVSVLIERGRPGSSQRDTIALRTGQDAFELEEGIQSSDYAALLPVTLEVKNVDNTEEYNYFVSFSYKPGGGRTKLVKSQVRIIVYVPPRITKEPVRYSRVNAGQNLTLTCNASGDPMIKITWSREGATTNQLVNATGYKLTLVNVQRKDVGSYRCTAYSPYGTAFSLAIVNVICSQCNTTTVGITIREGAVWRDALRNRESLEYKMLASNLTSAIVAPYSRPENEGNQLYEVAVREFRPGSVIAIVQMQFPRGISDPLQPLRSEMNDGRLGIFTIDRELHINRIPPRITREPARNSRVYPGQNLTLTCNASGAPVPDITWSREGATTNQLVNATGYKLTLVNVQRKDVGSYKCIANNPYGTASSLAIVNLICFQCKTITVGITIREGALWRDSLRNRESLEFKMLASNLTSAIIAPYNRPENEGKQLHEVSIKEFRPGSVTAIVQMQFPRDISDPLLPLWSEMNDGRLGIFTVDRELQVNPTAKPPDPPSPSAAKPPDPPSPSADVPSATSTTKTSASTSKTGLLVVIGGFTLLATVTVM